MSTMLIESRAHYENNFIGFLQEYWYSLRLVSITIAFIIEISAKRCAGISYAAIYYASR